MRTWLLEMGCIAQTDGRFVIPLVCSPLLLSVGFYGAQTNLRITCLLNLLFCKGGCLGDITVPESGDFSAPILGPAQCSQSAAFLRGTRGALTDTVTPLPFSCRFSLLRVQKEVGFPFVVKSLRIEGTPRGLFARHNFLAYEPPPRVWILL